MIKVFVKIKTRPHLLQLQSFNNFKLIMVKIDIYKANLALIIEQMIFLLKFKDSVIININFFNFPYFKIKKIQRIFKKFKL